MKKERLGTASAWLRWPVEAIRLRHRRCPGGPPASTSAILYFAGTAWDGVPGTDRELASQLSQHRPVVWVDPPTPAHKIVWRFVRGQVTRGRVTRELVGATLVVVRPLAPPGLTRLGIRRLTFWGAGIWGVRSLLSSGYSCHAVVVASAQQLIPRRAVRWGVPRVYFETDDFVAGASLFGQPQRRMQRLREVNVQRSTLVLAVSELLARSVAAGIREWATLPNGCNAARFASVDRTGPLAGLRIDAPIAAVIGQLNERLDFDALEKVARTGASLLLVGPRMPMSPRGNAQLDHLLGQPNVQWLGRRPVEQMPAVLDSTAVGLVPYVDSPFNRSSCPLKTLDYLAAGKAVVASDIPAMRQHPAGFVRVARDPSSFAALVADALAYPLTPSEAEMRRAYARRHDWSARALVLIQLIEKDRTALAEGSAQRNAVKCARRTRRHAFPACGFCASAALDPRDS